MSHVAKEKQKLLNRLKRLRGQLEAIERAVESDAECARVLQQATACRGAVRPPPTPTLMKADTPAARARPRTVSRSSAK